MKKLFALLLALSLMLTLAACGGGEQVANMDDNKETTANTTDATTDTTDETQGNTESTEGTTEATTPESTTPPTTEPKPTETTPPETQPTHKHSYSSKVTKAATCTAEGVKTFTCKCGSTYTEAIKAKGHSHTVTDSKKVTCTEDGYTKYTCACGDTYTETQTATGHSMGGWKYHTVGSMYTVGERRNSCANCSHYESEMQYDAFFEDYMETACRLGAFSSVDALTIDSVIQAIVNNVSYEDIGVNDRGHGCIAFKMDDVNKYTLNRLGRTYNYTNMGYIPTEAGGCTYDAETNTLVEERYEGGGCAKEYVGYTTTDNVHFVVTYNIDGATYTSNIELIGGKYIITSQTITWG